MGQLSQDEVTAAASPNAGPASVERRARVRYRCEQPRAGRAFITNTFRMLPARLVDLSQAGMALLLPEPVPVATRLLVELEGGAQEPAMEMLAEIVNVTAQADGSWRCGCALVWHITEAELQLLLKWAKPRAERPADLRSRVFAASIHSDFHPLAPNAGKTWEFAGRAGRSLSMERCLSCAMGCVAPACSTSRKRCRAPGIDRQGEIANIGTLVVRHQGRTSDHFSMFTLADAHPARVELRPLW